VARELQWKETASASSSSSDERMVGCATIPKNLMLVNLDGDNLRGQLFIISLLRESATKMEDNYFLSLALFKAAATKVAHAAASPCCWLCHNCRWLSHH